MSKPKVIAIVGPTASGKTALSVELARKYNGEIISADSRQVYRELDIGSGKITREEMNGVPHHLLDVADLNTTYTAVDFVRDTKVAIKDILRRGKLPIIVGGTFFYLDLLRNKITAAPVPPNPVLQAELEQLTTPELMQKLTALDPKRALSIDQFNRRRLIRALEIIASLGEVPNKKNFNESEYDWLVLGIDISNPQLHKRIEKRILERLENGMLEEVQSLLASGIDPTRLTELGLEYRFLTKYLLQEITYAEMVSQLFAKTRQFAKRQKTWLKRDESIVWKEFPVMANDFEKNIKSFLKL